jgi:hypothetical protein
MLTTVNNPYSPKLMCLFNCIVGNVDDNLNKKSTPCKRLNPGISLRDNPTATMKYTTQFKALLCTFVVIAYVLGQPCTERLTNQQPWLAP